MFTGIIQSVGEIAAVEASGADLRLRVCTGKLDLSDVQVGDSIAVSGVCLTAVALPGDGFWADVSGETLARTALADLRVGSRINLEKALTLSTRLGGHLVSGHVDGVGQVVRRWDDGHSVRFAIRAPDGLAKYIAEKGSIAVDGISLTVNRVNGAEFELNIVPHTLAQTTMDEFFAGRGVNLEVDLLARYLERLMQGDRAAQTDGGTTSISMEFLAENGFLKKN